MSVTFFSLGILLQFELINGDFEDGAIASAILGLRDEENK